jgi:glutathione synthase/RimK-type ligase-like ATP-grasp enzyme
LYSLEHSGKVVFPDFRTNWHFDDKVGQKYLLESIGAPLVKTYIFFKRQDAFIWLKTARFPLVFKLRTGAGSFNVKLIKTKQHAKRIIKTAFSRGFSNINSLAALKETIRKKRIGKANNTELLKRIGHLLVPPDYSKVLDKEWGYVYFQDFISDNHYDIRIIVIGERSFAIKRLVRENDFRASGSGNILYAKEHFDENTIALSFLLAEKLKMQCVAFDFVFQNGNPFLLEISYGFVPDGYKNCVGYWDAKMNWHEGKFNPYGWMVEDILAKVKGKAEALSKSTLA